MKHRIIALGWLILAVVSAGSASAADPTATDSITTNLAGPWKLGDKLPPENSPQVGKSALVISAEIEPAGPEGVIIAQGAYRNGYALYLADGKLALALRSQGLLTTVTAGQSLSSGHHRVAAKLAADGAVTLVVDGQTVATGHAPGLIAVQPAAGLTVGYNDFPVGDYPSPDQFAGNIEQAMVQAIPVAGPFPAPAAPAPTVATELPVPKISEVARVDRDSPPSAQDATTATYILKTNPHATLGEAYVIVTDQTNEASLHSLERLAAFHHGTILRTKDLSALDTPPARRDQLIAGLRQAQPRFVAIAPRPYNFTKSMLAGMWSVLTALGDDHQLPVFPGILAAPNPMALNALVDRSINYRPLAQSQVSPFVMGQVLSSEPFGLRSLQKVRMMTNLFGDYGCPTHSLVILASTAVAAGLIVAPAPGQWQVAMTNPGQFIKSIPAAAQSALNDSSLLLLFGHGSPETECCLDFSAFRNVRMTGKIVMSGNCYSAAVTASGASPTDESFALLAVEKGAAVVFAHMTENAGFPHLFPVLENWMQGLTVGEAYQRQINALIAQNGASPNDFGSTTQPEAGADDLLYVVIGDPALQPLVKMTPLKP